MLVCMYVQSNFLSVSQYIVQTFKFSTFKTKCPINCLDESFNSIKFGADENLSKSSKDFKKFHWLQRNLYF